ncbi:MAG: hypothetical protein MR640_00330 [Subdoligranulum sp.]|nr:hypothetical protein [Subdoligranulum sp.]
MSGCGTRIVLRGQKPLALCDRCPCFGSLFPPLAALTFAASSIICAFGLASAVPRSPYRHLELCGIAILFLQTQRDFALKTLGIHKEFLRLFALNPVCVCEISGIFFVFRYTLKRGYIPQVYLNRIYPYIVMRIEYLVKFTAWRALLWAKSRSTAPRPQ